MSGGQASWAEGEGAWGPGSSEQPEKLKQVGGRALLGVRSNAHSRQARQWGPTCSWPADHPRLILTRHTSSQLPTASDPGPSPWAPPPCPPYAPLPQKAAHLPVHFHVGVSPQTIEEVMHSSLVQWHLTGVELEAGEEDPASEEHFGISIAEGEAGGATGWVGGIDGSVGRRCTPPRC